MPGCTMKIFTGDPSNKEVAESVKIGDPLSLQVSLDRQDTYGIRVTDCLVKDGIGSGEQKLINDRGCPLDSEIMGMFQYSEDKTTAIVKFQAHKFPSTESVYYQCNVKLCLKAHGGCVETNVSVFYDLCFHAKFRKHTAKLLSKEKRFILMNIYVEFRCSNCN